MEARLLAGLTVSIRCLTFELKNESGESYDGADVREDKATVDVTDFPNRKLTLGSFVNGSG